MTRLSQTIDTALNYAGHGWPVLALVPGSKIPIKDDELQPHGCLSATTDPARIAALFRRNPDANLGLATGHVFDVADYDGPHIARVAKARGLVAPATFAVRTRRGFHVYVKSDPRVPVKASIMGAGCDCTIDGKPKPCALDTRGKGGYVVAPPSVVLGHIYWVERNLSIAPWPELYEFCAALEPPKPPPATDRRDPPGEGLIARIKAAWTVEGLAERLGARLIGQGDQLKARCPLHGERTGFAFVVWRRDQRWKCFGKCNAGGDVIDLYRLADQRGML